MAEGFVRHLVIGTQFISLFPQLLNWIISGYEMSPVPVDSALLLFFLSSFWLKKKAA